MMRRFHSLVLLSLLYFSTNFSFAQSSFNYLRTKIDSLFQDTKADAPGYAFGMVLNDSLVYSKGFGLANIEYNIPNSPGTLFDMGSVSKQFTAYSIILLIKENKLALTDDIRKYLKWFPDLKTKITIQHLLNHTSGIRDLDNLLTVLGKQEDFAKHENIIRILREQNSLNFKPGERFSYSNTNYFLLAEIIEAVSGKSLRKFADSAIFKPLKMSKTFFNDNYLYEIVKDKACSYDKIAESLYENNIITNDLAGPSALYSNITDMSKWIMNFYAPQVGDLAAIDRLVTQGKLNNGELLKYANGMEVITYKGHKIYLHGGAVGSYKSLIVVLPKVKAGLIISSNTKELDILRNVQKITDILLSENNGKLDNIDSSLAVLKDTMSIKKYLGSYISETGNMRTVLLKNNKLYFTNGNTSTLLYPENNNIYFVHNKSDMSSAPKTKYTFYTDSVTKKIRMDKLDRSRAPFTKYENINYTSEELKKISGSYYCPELNTNYIIEFIDNKLILKYVKFDIPLSIIGPGYLYAEYCYVLIKNKKNEITGFEMNSERMLHLRFNKTK